MSQVKKFLNGSVIKAEEGNKSPEPQRTYGHIWVDGIDYGNSEDVYNAFAQHARNQGLNQGEFYDQWLTALRNGQDVVFGNGNTVNMKPEDMSASRASKRSGWTKFWDDTFDTRRNHFSDAIATARRFTFVPQENAKKETSKTSHFNDRASFDYNGDGDEAVYSADNPGNLGIVKRFSSYLDWLESPDTWNETNQFSTAPTVDQTHALKAWYQQFTGNTPEARRSAAQAAIDKALEAVYNTKGGYGKVPENYRDLFAYFNIGDTPAAAGSTPEGGTSGSTDFWNSDGSINHGARTSNGSFMIQKGNGAGENDGYYTNWNGDTSTPYIITRNDWDTLGLNGDYEFLRNGVIYNGRIWTPEELSTQTGNPLYGTMERVKAINADTSLTGQERFNRLSQLANWYGKASGYNQFDWNPDTYYTINPSLREALSKYKNLSLYDASKSFGFEPGVLLGAYDNSIAGTENWGLRSPFYLMKNQNNKFIAITAEQLSQMFPQNTYNPYSANGAFDSNSIFTNWVDLMGDGRYFGLAFTTQGTDRDSRTGQLRQYQIYEGRDGKFYHKKNNNQLVELSPDLVEWIRQGNHPNNRQMDNGTLDGKGKYGYQEGGGYAQVHKEGGKVNAYQIGGSFEGGPNGVQQVNVDQSPLQEASYLQDSLTDADWKEISAAALDLSGAIAGLVPGGSIYTAGSGLVSTGLYLSAAKDRKGKTDLSDWGQAGLSTILDAVSLLPYVGEAGKLAKIGKGISKVAVPLGKVFNMIGLAHLVPTLTKNPKDWTSDDLIALSTGLTAALNVGHSAHTSRGDSKLAAEISKIRKAQPVEEFKYHKTFKIEDTPTDIELSPGDIAKVVESKTPGNTLKDILKQTYKVSDDQLGNPKQLLEDFGFETGTRRFHFKDKRIKASQHQEQELPEYSERGWMGDQFRIFGNPEIARRQYIDLNMKDPKVRAKVEAFSKKRITGSHNSNAINDEITTTTYNREFEDPRLRRAYAQSLMRLGDENARMNWTGHIWSGAELNPITETTIKRNPTNAQLEKAISNSSYRISDNAIQMTRAARENPGAMTQSLLSELPARRTVAEATGFTPKVSRESRLGASGMSNKEIADWANNIKKKGMPAGDEPVTVDDVVELLNSLPENRRWSLIQYFRNNTNGKNTREAAARFLPKREEGTTTLRDIHDRINNAQAIKDENAKSAFNEARDIARTLIALRESKDPMATLRLLSQKPDFDERVFAHPEEFREALEYAKAHGKYAKMSPKQKHQYDFELEQLMEGRNLLFKQGGKVIKASGGLSQAMWNVVNGMSLTPYNNATAALTIANGGQDTSLVDSALAQQRGKTVTATPSGNTYENQNPFEGFTSENFHPDGMRTIRTSAKTNNAEAYGDTSYDSSPAWTSLIKGGLSALDYGSMAWGRHKVHDQIEKGLKNSLYKRVTPYLHGVSTATPIEDAAVARADQYISRGQTTPLTSNALTNNLTALTLQGNGLQARDQAERERSAAALQRHQLNQQIINQQHQMWAENENDFRARLAGLRMNLAQNDASLTAQTAQSIQNLAREWRTNFNAQTDKFNQLRYNNQVSTQTELADNNWKTLIRTNSPDAYAAWNNMSASDRIKYGNDITTWLQQSEYWTPALENLYTSNRKGLSQAVESAFKNTIMSPWFGNLYRNREGVPVKRSGGSLTIKQRNRYKNEPSEDIWINQNKATHKLVAKLNDNVIKTFLKTLK